MNILFAYILREEMLKVRIFHLKKLGGKTANYTQEK